MEAWERWIVLAGAAKNSTLSGGYRPPLRRRESRKGRFDGRAFVSFLSLAMQLTKQQKVYAAVLGLAVAAFAFDRWVLGPGDAEPTEEVAAPRRTPRRPTASLSATETGVVVPTPAAPAQGTTATAPATSAGTALAARLEAIAKARHLNLEKVGDAFRPSTAWVGAPKQINTNKELTDAAREYQKHKLMAVMKQTGGGVAIIDKDTVPVGHTFDGFRLVAVRDRSAILRRGNLKVELKLAIDDSLAGGGATPGATSDKIAGTDAGE